LIRKNIAGTSIRCDEQQADGDAFAAIDDAESDWMAV